MSVDEVFAASAVELRAIADLLDGLDAQQLATPSLLRRHAESRFAPPVTGARAPLTDALVHAGDMRVPLGLPHDPTPDHVRPLLKNLHGVGAVTLAARVRSR